MTELKIKSHDYWSYHFSLSTCVDIPETFRICSYCGEVRLDPVYVYIVDSLKEAGLLDKNYGLICCYCFILEKMDMMQHVHDLSGIHYNKDNDILEIETSFREKIKGEETVHIISFYVHNWSKVGGR